MPWRTQAQSALFAWIQGSYRFLDSKFKIFSRLFSTTMSFSSLKVIKYVSNRKRDKAFLYDALKQKYGQKFSRFFNHFFQTLSPFSRLFGGLENCRANFMTVSQEFKMMSTGFHLAFGPHSSLSY